MAIHLLNYRHGHLHTHYGAPSVVLEMSPALAGRGHLQAEARAANGAKWEARFPAAGRKQAGWQKPAWLILPRGTGWAEHPPPFLQFSTAPSHSCAGSGHQALLRMG